MISRELTRLTGLIAGVALVAALLAGIVFSSSVSLAPKAGKSLLRMNQIQVIGTHNSYHRELTQQEEAEYDEIVNRPGDYQEFLAYSHATIPRQLASQDVRGLELDLFPRPRGRSVRRAAGAQEGSDSAPCRTRRGANPGSRSPTSPTWTTRLPACNSRPAWSR